MKVLQINSVCGIRSTGRICTDISDILEQNGHECKIAYGRCEVPEKYQKKSVKIGSNFDVYCHAAMSRLFDNAGFGSKKATEKFIEWIKEYDPDIIHLHNIHGYYINIEMLFKYLAQADKPVIWTLHDCWAFTGHCAHFSAAGCEKWKTGCKDCKLKKQYPSSNLIDRSSKNWLEKKMLFTSVKNMTLVTPSRWLAEVVKKSFLGKYPVQVIYNGIDLDIFKPTESDFRERYGLKNKKIILGVASAWSENKGLNDYVKLSHIIDDSYKIILVGLSEEQMKMLTDNMIGIAKTNSIKELAEIYSAADIYVNFSKEETMGLTTVEAMACGTPVLVSDLTAIPEVVDECGGKIFDDWDMHKIMNNIREFDHVTYNPRKNASKYEKKDHYNKYYELYIKK